MNALLDFSTATPAEPLFPSFGPLRARQSPAPRQPAAACPPPRPMLNCVSAAELGRQMEMAFAAAGDWFSLCRGLRRKGICLRMRNGDLWVCDAVSLAAISSCEDLGIDTDELELRFGPSQPERCSAHAA